MRVLWQWIIFGLLAAGPANAGGISGTYVEKASDGVFLVQVVQTGDGHLTGRLEMISLKPNGDLADVSAPISGASDGHTVVITITPTEVLARSVTISGTIEGPLLHLTGGPTELTLIKSDEAEFREQVSALREKARGINKTRAHAEELAHLDDLKKKLIASSTEADAQLAKFPPIEQRYRRITEWMNAALARQRSIYGAGQASVARSQVGVAINQASIETEQLHGSLQGANQDIGTKIQPLIKDIVDFDQRCKSSALPQDADVRDGCVKFFESVKKFKQSMEALSQAFDRAEKVWIEEQRKQQGIIQASNVASR